MQYTGDVHFIYIIYNGLVVGVTETRWEQNCFQQWCSWFVMG